MAMHQLEICSPSPSIVPPLGLISGSAREDIDNDGVGDLTLSNLNITIFGFGSLDSSPTTLTDSEGNYAFFDVPADGTYAIFPTNLIGFGGAINTSIIVTLAAGDVSTGNMLILPPLGLISGSVKEDTDNDGVGDANLANVFILLAGYDVTFFAATRR